MPVLRRKKRTRKRAPGQIDLALNAFGRECGVKLEELKPHEKGALFEHFSAYHILRQLHDQELQPGKLDGLIVGGTHDNQLDCVVYIVDGGIVDSEAAADVAIEAGGDVIDIAMVFIQATRMNHFDRDKIGKFVNGVQSACADAAYFTENEDLQRKRALKEYLLEKAAAAGLGVNAYIYGYFAALGRWDESNPDEHNKKGEFARGRAELTKHDWIEGAEFEAVDKERLLDMIAASYRADMAEAVAGIELEEYEGVLPERGFVPLPPMNGVGAGYHGYARVGDYLALLEREDGQGLRESVFTMNVRGYQGDNTVNKRIRDTLSGPDRAKFVLRNNGVTLVSDRIEKERGAIRLYNFQVINGLQTSNVLYRMRDELRGAEDVYVSLKLVSGVEPAERLAIIDATNRQTPISGAGLFAASPRAIALEHHFADRVRQDGAGVLLERRRGQFSATPEADVMPLEDLLRAYCAVFLQKSHLAEAGFAKIRGELDESALFGETALNEAYYASALLLQYVRRISNARMIHKLDELELHAALALRVMCAEEIPLLAEPEEVRRCCAEIEAQLARPENFDECAKRLELVTQSPRDKLKNGKRETPNLKKTMDDIMGRARQNRLDAAETTA